MTRMRRSGPNNLCRTSGLSKLRDFRVVRRSWGKPQSRVTRPSRSSSVIHHPRHPVHHPSLLRLLRPPPLRPAVVVESRSRVATFPLAVLAAHLLPFWHGFGTVRVFAKFFCCLGLFGDFLGASILRGANTTASCGKRRFTHSMRARAARSVCSILGTPSKHGFGTVLARFGGELSIG